MVSICPPEAPVRARSLPDRDGAAFSQRDVVLTGPALVGMTFERHAGARMVRQPLCVSLDYGAVLLLDLAAVEGEVDRALRERTGRVVERVALKGSLIGHALRGGVVGGLLGLALDDFGLHDLIFPGGHLTFAGAEQEGGDADEGKPLQYASLHGFS